MSIKKTCAAKYCLSSSQTHKDVKFLQFPRDAERRNVWVRACRRTDIIDKDWEFFKTQYVCSKHFQQCMYYVKRQNLRDSAFPSINFTFKPLQRNSCTQTWESMVYLRPFHNIQESNADGDVSILYVTKKCTKTSSTQTDGIFVLDTHQDDVIEEKKPKLKDLIVFEEDEIKSENDDNIDPELFKQYENSQPYVAENEVLPIILSTRSLRSVVPKTEVVEDDGTLCSRDTKPLQKFDNYEKADLENKSKRSLEIDTDAISMMPKKQKVEEIIKVDKTVQTDRVIVFNNHGEEEDINPEDCTCKIDPYAPITRGQFFRLCNKFLSQSFCAIVRKQMFLDGLTQKLSSDSGV